MRLKRFITILLAIACVIPDTLYAATTNFNSQSAKYYLVCPYCAKVTKLQTDAGVNKQCSNEKCRERLDSQSILSSGDDAYKLSRRIKEERMAKANSLNIKSDSGVKCQYCMRNEYLDIYEILAIVEGRRSRTIICKGCGQEYDFIDGINFYEIRKEKEARAFMRGVAIVGLAVVAGVAVAAANSGGGGGNYNPQPVYTPMPIAYSTPACVSSPAPIVSGSTMSSGTPTYLGRLSANKYAADSTSNPYGQYGSPYSATSINNPYSTYGNQVHSPYTTTAPKIFGSDGTYLGKLSSNPYDSESTSNPYGKYGSRYSATSVNNPYSQYGSRYSSQSPNNPYSSDGPVIIGE